MNDIFRAEFIRFRAWSLAAALVHLAVLGFFARMVDPLQQPLLVYQVVAGVYAALGLLLGLYQMGGYRRPNTWLNLLHRPLPHARIAAALCGAGSLQLLVALALPVLLVIAGQSLWTARVVDSRHWLLPLASWLVASCTYLAGCYAMLAPRRYSALVLVLPALLLASQASGGAAIIVQVLVLAWLGLLLRAAFKPDLGAPPRSALAEIATVLPVQMALYLLLVAATLPYHLGWIVLGTHPLNSTPPPGGFIEAARADKRDRMLAGLAGSRHPQAPLWREQLRISDIHDLQVQFEAFPKRGGMTNPAPLEFDDGERRRRWIFSHDAMRFSGVLLADRSAAGTLGIGETNERFVLPPMPIGDTTLADARGLYEYDSERQRIVPRLQLPAGEVLAAAPAKAGESLLVLSDRALYFHDAMRFSDESSLSLPRQRLPLSGKIGDLADIDLIELLDGHLLSILYGRGSIDAPGDAWQEMWWIDASGRATQVARRGLRPDFPVALRHYGWWLSPGLHALRNGATGFLAEPAPLQARDPGPRPTSMRLLAAVLMLASLLAAVPLTRRQGLSGLRRGTWLVGCGALGLPALISLRLLHPDQEVEASTARPAPARKLEKHPATA